MSGFVDVDNLGAFMSDSFVDVDNLGAFMSDRL